MCIYINNYKIVGETWIKSSKSNKRVRVIISKTKCPIFNFNEYQLIKKSNKSSKNDKILGDITIDIRKSNDYVYVHDLNSYRKEKYKFVGSRLMQVAMEVSHLKEKGGNVELYSLSQALGFYYKIGLKGCVGWSLSEYEIRKIDQTVMCELALAKKENRKPNINEVEGCGMRLPETEIERKFQEIKKFPILYKSNTLIKKNVG